MERLSVAVKCHDCNNTTRNLSGFCQHHGRNSKATYQVASASGALTSVRLTEVHQLKKMDPARVEEANVLGQYLVSVRPTVLVDTVHHTATIKNAFSTETDEETFRWGEDSAKVGHGQGFDHGDVTFYRAGADLLAYPNAELPHAKRVELLAGVTEQAFETAQGVRNLRAEHYELASKCETYDDKAETLAQLRLGGNDAGAVRYSTPSDGKVIVFVRSPTNADVIERWTLERSPSIPDDGSAVQEYAYRYKVVGEGELVSRRTREKIADYIDGNARHERTELISNIREAIETIDKHAVTTNGKVHLPLGWTD